MTTNQICEIFGLHTLATRVLKDDEDILRVIKCCKNLSEKFDEIYDDDESEDDEI